MSDIRKVVHGILVEADTGLKSGLEFAGDEEPVPFKKKITIEVSGTVRGIKYIDRATGKASPAKEYEVNFDRESITQQVTPAIFGAVQEATGDTIPPQSSGAWAGINFPMRFRNAAAQEDYDKMWGRK